MFCQHTSQGLAICFGILCFYFILDLVVLQAILPKQNILMFVNNFGGKGGGENRDFQIHFEMPRFPTQQQSHFALSSWYQLWLHRS